MRPAAEIAMLSGKTTQHTFLTMAVFCAAFSDAQFAFTEGKASPLVELINNGN